ncbi:MAG: RagB/SusD family nutrient uptake outer membrane protein [Saprospiraceae bacterium]|nr:RagB/SusD family nutrient uptake outer membrane protein [Saprospiraceae bacterium]
MKSYLTIGALILFLFSSCNQQLNLQPAQSISEALALSTSSNVVAILIGAYDEMGVSDLFGGETLRNAELQAGDGEILWVGTFNAPREIFNKDMLTTNLDAREVWLEGYEVINIVNNVLSALQVVDPDIRDRVEGEALFIRAMIYFELVRFYAKPYVAGQPNDQMGIPIVTMPTRSIDEKDEVTRNTVEEVYAQIIDDLTRAQAILPETNGVFATTYTVSALLSRVFLQQGRFADARDAAHRVITSGRFGLMPTYAEAFNNDANTMEDIFAMQVSSQDGVNVMNTFFSVPQFGGRDGDIEILQQHLNLYNPADDRLNLFFQRGGVFHTGKWNNQFGNVVLIRLAEMYLTRAETNFRLGSNIGATPLQDYNRIHMRAGLLPAVQVTLADILLERKLELAFEGHRIHDVKRLQQNVGNLAFDADKLVFPIPAREIEANPNLEQNPGY